MRIRCTNPVLLLYLAWAYLVPAAMNAWTGYESELYVNPTSGVLAWLYAGLLCAITVAFAFTIESAKPRAPCEPPPVWQVPLQPVVALLLGILAVAAIGFASGLSRWRYAEEGLSSSLGPVELLYVLAPNVLELLLFVLLFFRYELPAATRRALLLLLALCMGLTASGIGPMLALLLALLAAVAPQTLQGLILREDHSGGTAQHDDLATRLLLLTPLLALAGVGAYLVGDAIKTDASIFDVLDNLQQDGLGLFLDYLIGRLSVQWYSLTAAVHQFVQLGVGGEFDNLMAPVTNAAFRLSSLLGGVLGLERPLDGSLGRINYGLINLYPYNDREGTTPGLIASFVIAFPVWLGPFALAGYLALYDRVQRGLRQRLAGRPTWLGEALLLYFTTVFFASPPDFLLLFDPMLLSVGAWCYLAYAAPVKGRAHASLHPVA